VEHILVDGASNDGTRELIDAESTSPGTQLSHWVSEPDDGIYHALNKGLAAATGDIVGFLSGDDVLAGPSVLRRVAECFRDPKVVACYGDLVYVKRTDPNRIVRHWRAGEFIPKLLAAGWMPPHPTLYVRRSWYDDNGAFDTRYRIAADYDLMLRLLKSPGGQVVYLPEVLVRMRLGGASNGSLRGVLRKSIEDYRALRSNQVGGVGALVWKNLSKVPQFFQRPKSRAATVTARD
jgi:glycosyltransferase involved in cell wall biosynthesis